MPPNLLFSKSPIQNFSFTHAHLQPPTNILNNLLRLRLTPHIRAQQLGLLKVRIDSLVDPRRRFLLADKLEHERSGANSSNRVRDALALNVGRRSVAGLADDKVLADVGRRHETERADEGGGAVGQDVAVEVGGDNDVVVLGLAEELVHHRVDDLLFDTDALVLGVLQSAARCLAEEAVGLREHVGLVCDCDERARVDRVAASVAHTLSAQGDVAGHGSNVERGCLGDALDSLCDLGAVGRRVRLLLLDVKVLGVFAHNDEVDIAQAAADALDRAHVGVQLHLLTQCDNGARVALCLDCGRADGTEEGTIAVRLQCLDSLLGQGGARLLERLPARLVVREGKLKTQRRGKRLEDAAAGGDDLAANAIAGNEA
jgi:hypothetical protein